MSRKVYRKHFAMRIQFDEKKITNIDSNTRWKFGSKAF